MSSGTSPQAKKKGFTMPHTFVILVVIILIATALTWVIPSGEYARIEDPISGRNLLYLCGQCPRQPNSASHADHQRFLC